MDYLLEKWQNFSNQKRIYKKKKKKKKDKNVINHDKTLHCNKTKKFQ
jgi:hypothetical protein